MATLYLRVSEETKAYVSAVARDAGISENRAAEVLLQRAQAERWVIERMTATVRPADESDAD